MDEIDWFDRKMLEELNDFTTYHKFPPHTGAQRCSCCGGWIISPQRFYENNNGPICPNCYFNRNKSSVYV